MATAQEKLEEAIAARHALILGKKAVSIGLGDRRMEYTPADLKALESYIAELRREVAGKRRQRNRISYPVPD